MDPIEEHDVVIRREPGYGFVVRTCYTCMRHFANDEEHREYVEFG
jgi:hypothetical protein